MRWRSGDFAATPFETRCERPAAAVDLLMSDVRKDDGLAPSTSVRMHVSVCVCILYQY